MGIAQIPGMREARLALLVCAFLLVAVVAVQGNEEADAPLGEDDEAENSLQARESPPADVFLSASVGVDEEDQAPAKAKAKGQVAIVTLDGGGELHVGPQAIVNTKGAPVRVKKGSKLAVSQRA